jgi:hypothetical protein
VCWFSPRGTMWTSQFFSLIWLIICQIAGSQWGGETWHSSFHGPQFSMCPEYIAIAIREVIAYSCLLSFFGSI